MWKDECPLKWVKVKSDYMRKWSGECEWVMMEVQVKVVARKDQKLPLAADGNLGVSGHRL